MKIPVLLALPAQETLRESAAAATVGQPSEDALRRTKVPAGFEIDVSLPAIPLGELRKDSIVLESLTPGGSQDFVVSGNLEVANFDAIPEEVEGRPVFADPKISAFPYCAGAPVGGVADVASRLSLGAIHARGLDGDGVAIVIMDTGVNIPFINTTHGLAVRFDAANSWAPPGSLQRPGLFPVDHGTMCAFDSLIAAPKATILDYSILSGRSPGGSAMSGSLGTAVRAYADLLAKYAVMFAPGGPYQYRGLVISNSWGMYHPSWDFPAGHPGRYCDNPRHPFATMVAALVTAGADFVFAAGNCGSQCPDNRCAGRTAGTIMGASSYSDVLTVAACLATTEDRLGYSSQGPSITGMYQQKPDITAHAHFTGSLAYGPGSPDSGTSTACPVAAGCVAAIRTKRPPAMVPPAALITQIQTYGRPPVGFAPGTYPPGWNGDYGYGILDVDGVARSFGV